LQCSIVLQQEGRRGRGSRAGAAIITAFSNRDGNLDATLEG
jgi:hypothetical protein